MDKQTYTRSVENFKMVTFPENPEEGLTHEISEVEIRIECLPDKTITLIELELTFNDEKGRILVNIHKIYKDEVTIEDDFRGSIFWTLEAFDSLKESLTKHFQKIGLQTPSDFIKNRIVLEAKRQLLYTNDSVKHIAYNLGFNDSAYFTRFFKKATLKSPLQFKKDQKN